MRYWHEFKQAVFKNDPEQLIKLLGKVREEGVDINDSSNGVPVLYMAAINCRELLVEILLDHGADIHSRTQRRHATPLHGAAAAMDNEPGSTVKMLISRGADVNARTNDGQTPLHYVADTKNIYAAKLLIAHGADILSEDNHTFRPYHLAVLEGKVSMMELLKPPVKHVEKVKADKANSNQGYLRK